MRIAITGHRPPNLPGGYDETCHEEIKEWIAKELRVASVGSGIDNITAACGMALGCDLYFAEACIDLRIPFEAFIPFEGQELRWPRKTQERYYNAIGHAVKTHEAAPSYSTGAYFERNRMLLGWLKNGDPQRLLAVWNGVNSGGTYFTFSEARSLDIPICFLHVGEGA